MPVYLNEQLNFEYVLDPIQFGSFGITSSGKSYTTSIVMNQFPSGISFDPQARAWDILKMQGEEKNWRYLKIQYKQKKNSFLMNAEDLHERIVNSLARTQNTKDYRLRRALMDFFKYSRAQRTYINLEHCFQKHRLLQQLDELTMILSKNDSAPSLDSYNSGKTLIDISHLSEQNICIGTIIESIIGWRQERIFPNDPFFIAMDEAQRFAKFRTLCGEAISNCANRGRIFGVSTIVMATNYSSVEKGIRKALKIFLFFKNSFYSKDLNQEFSLDLQEEKLKMIPFGDEKSQKGFCLYCNKNENLSSGILLRPNLYFKKRHFRSVPQNQFSPITAPFNKYSRHFFS